MPAEGETRWQLSVYNLNGLLHPDSNYKRKFEQVLVQAKQITDWALQSEAHS